MTADSGNAQWASQQRIQASTRPALRAAEGAPFLPPFPSTFIVHTRLFLVAAIAWHRDQPWTHQVLTSQNLPGEEILLSQLISLRESSLSRDEMQLHPAPESGQSAPCTRLLHLAPLLSNLLPLLLDPPPSSPTSPLVYLRQTHPHGNPKPHPTPFSSVQKLIRTTSAVASIYLALRAPNTSRGSRRRENSTILTPIPYPFVVQRIQRLSLTQAAPSLLAMLQLRLLTVIHPLTNVFSTTERMILCVSPSSRDRQAESRRYPNLLAISSRPLQRPPMLHR